MFGSCHHNVISCVYQRLETARTLIKDDEMMSKALEFGIDIDDEVVTPRASTTEKCTAPVCQQIKSENVQLKLDLQAAQLLNQELRTDFEHVVSLVANQRGLTPTPSPIDEAMRVSPSAVLLELLTSAVATWKDKV